MKKDLPPVPMWAWGVMIALNSIAIIILAVKLILRG